MDRHALRAFVGLPGLLTSSAIFFSTGLLVGGQIDVAYGQDKAPPKGNDTKAEPPAGKTPDTTPPPAPRDNRGAPFTILNDLYLTDAQFTSAIKSTYGNVKRLEKDSADKKINLEILKNTSGPGQNVKEIKDAQNSFDATLQPLSVARTLLRHQVRYWIKDRDREGFKLYEKYIKEIIDAGSPHADPNVVKKIENDYNNAVNAAVDAYIEKLGNPDKPASDGAPPPKTGEAPPDKGDKKSSMNSGGVPGQGFANQIPGADPGSQALTAIGNFAGVPMSYPGVSDFPYWQTRPVSADGTVMCTFGFGSSYPMTFSPSDPYGNPLGSYSGSGPSTTSGGSPTNYGVAPYEDAYIKWVTSSATPNPYIVPRNNDGPISFGNYPEFFYDPVTGNWVTSYFPILPVNPGGDIIGGGVPVIQNSTISNNSIPTLSTDDPKTPPAQGGGVLIPGGQLTIQNSTVPNNSISTLTTDDPTPPPTGGLTTYFFKGPEIKKETGTAEQGQSVSLNTQPTPFLVKITSGLPQLPFFNNPQRWEQWTQQNNWNGGGPLTTTVNPGQTSTIQTATGDPLLGLPRAFGAQNFNFVVSPYNPNIFSYIIEPQPGLFPNFTAQIGGNVIGLGDFNGDGRADIIWHGTNGNLNAWSYNDWNSWSYSPNFTGGVNAVAGDFSGDGRSDIIFNSSNGLRYLQLDEPLKFNERSFFPIYGTGYDPGPKLQEQFGGKVSVNTCWLTLPGEWEPAAASYAPGSDLPDATLTLRKPARSARVKR